MKHIDELIGIIEGINIDDVINELETSSLKNWVEKNKNLAYDADQINLITLVDTVLEDNYIDEIEKKQLMALANSIRNKSDDSSLRIYELNGIIEGIICDNVINEVEIYKLKEWMENNDDIVSSNSLSGEIVSAINDILEDGIITADEKDSLLQLLSSRITDAKLDAKLDYLCEQVKEKSIIGVDLIDILDNDVVINEIHSRAEKELIKVLRRNSSLFTNNEVIVVSLILIAMLEYDGNYYSNVRNTYTDAYWEFSEQKVEGYIRSILNKYKTEEDEGTRTRIINVALENSIVPKAFLPSFFEFVFDIYKLNFDYDLPEEPYEDFKFVFEGLRNNLLSEGDDISINVTQKTYKLIAATKQLIKKEDGLDALIKLCIIVAKLIDNRFWDKDVQVLNTYLKEGFDSWSLQLRDEDNRTKSHHGVNTDFRSKWEPKFIMHDNDVYLEPPAHRVKSQYDYKDIFISVINDDIEIYREDNCFIKEIIGGYQVVPQKIKMEKPLGSVTYRLLCGDEVIYDSKDKLNRDYIIFNSDGSEINNNTDYDGIAYICYKPGETELTDIVQNKYYHIGYKAVHSGDTLSVGHDVINFSAMVKPGVFGHTYDNCYVRKSGTDNYIAVYRDVNVIVFEANDKSTKFEVLINNKPYKLSEMPYKMTMRGNIVKYIVDLEIIESGFYEIEVNQIIEGTRNRILRDAFIYDDSLSFEVRKKEDNHYGVIVLSGILDEIIDTEISPENFDPGFIKIIYKDEVYYYTLPFNLGFYQIDEGKWKSKKEDLWIDNIHLDSVMKLYDSSIDELKVFTDEGAVAEENIELIDEGVIKKIKLGFINSYKNTNDYVSMVFYSNGHQAYTLTCYNKCIIDDAKTTILYDDNSTQVTVSPVFHGENPVYFEIINREEQIFLSRLLVSGENCKINGLKTFENYTFIFYEKTKTLRLKEHTLLARRKIKFYSKKDFVGRTFMISTVYYDRFIHGEYVKRPYYFNRIYVVINNMINENLFEGEIIVKASNNTFKLSNINPVEIELCSEIVDNTIDAYMTNQGDGLLLDFQKHGILNSMEDATAPDIFLFTLNIK